MLTADGRVAFSHLQAHIRFPKPNMHRSLRPEALAAPTSGHTELPPCGQFPRALADHGCFLQQIKKLF